MTKAVTLPANDTHWFDKLSTVILPVYVLQVINQTINARTIPPTEPPTAPAWFKSFHVKAKAIGKTPDAVAHPRKLNNQPMDIFAAP